MRGRLRVACRAASIGIAALLGVGIPMGTGAATTTLGQTGAPNLNGCQAISWLQRTNAVSSPSYAAPAGGVITSWSYQAGAAGGAIKLKIYRPTVNPQQFMVVTESAVQTVPANTLSTFTTSLTVQANDRLGFQITSGTPGCFIPASAGTPGDTVSYEFANTGVGGTATFSDCTGGSCGVSDNNRLDVSAVFGTRASSTQVSCVPGSVDVSQSQASTCTVTVSDTAPGAPTTPTGAVTLASDGAGAFGPGPSCTLVAGTVGVASCSVTYSPSAVGSGTHTITASYPGDTVHDPSTGNTTVTVTAPGVPAAPSLPAVPSLPKAGAGPQG